MQYKIGDIIACRTYDDCINAGFRPSESGDFDDIFLSYVKAMYTNFGNQLVEITDISGRYIEIVLLTTRKAPEVSGRHYSWSVEMLKPAILTTPSGNSIYNIADL